MSHNSLEEQFERAIRQLNKEANANQQSAARQITHKRKKNNSPRSSPKSVFYIKKDVRQIPYNKMPFSQVRWLVNYWPNKTNKERVTRPALQEARKAFAESGFDSETAYKEYSKIIQAAYNAYYRSEYARWQSLKK